MSHSFLQVCHKIVSVYHQIDSATNRIRAATGLNCPAGCGACCCSLDVESTVLEMLPMAHHLANWRLSDGIYNSLEIAETTGNRTCVLYQSDITEPGQGRCSQYSHRPLICRLFGFGARLNKNGEPEPQVCRLFRIHQPEAVEGFRNLCRTGNAPLYRNYFSKIAVLNTQIGFRILPVNQALKQALDYYYWKKPKRFGVKLAS